ncbi:hypothetical protein JTE90_019015 [Oedothorax gibbosus]|uniref:Uncharacterized protein n=1 Tax=Oedothorax gibbosus TaxID=931172 RepID=A0AAV6UXX1_9ARAC|nr:hypothetical protein JTE90_019015 [Oedothorax gibbosus]
MCPQSVLDHVYGYKQAQILERLQRLRVKYLKPSAFKKIEDLGKKNGGSIINYKIAPAKKSGRKKRPRSKKAKQKQVVSSSLNNINDDDDPQIIYENVNQVLQVPPRAQEILKAHSETCYCDDCEIYRPRKEIEYSEEDINCMEQRILLETLFPPPKNKSYVVPLYDIFPGDRKEQEFVRSDNNVGAYVDLV